jgi:hypothetical protein
MRRLGARRRERWIYLAALDFDETTLLSASDTRGAYLPAGWLIWIQGGAVGTALRSDILRCLNRIERSDVRLRRTPQRFNRGNVPESKTAHAARGETKRTVT